MDNRISLVSSILPDSLVCAIRSGISGDPITEKRMTQAAKLLKNLTKRTADAYLRGAYTLFDGNPGDAGCQNQALAIRRIASLNLVNECERLKETAKNIEEVLLKREKIKGKNRCAPIDLIQKECNSDISQEINYLLLCFMATVTRTPVGKTEDGAVLTSCRWDKLRDFNLRLEDNFLEDIVKKMKESLSILSINAVLYEAHTLTYIQGSEKDIMIRMLSGSNIRTLHFSKEIYNRNTRTVDHKKYGQKSFGCLFYEIKTLLLGLRARQDILCIRKICNKEAEDMLLFYQSQEPGAPFSLLSDKRIPDQAMVTVMECIIRGCPGEVVREVEEVGLTQLVLQHSAFEAPYESKSTLEVIKDKEALAEMARYRKRKPETFAIDHIYLTKWEEGRLCQEGRPWIL